MGEVLADTSKTSTEAGSAAKDSRKSRALSARKKALYYLLMIVMSIAVVVGIGEVFVRLWAIDRPIPLTDKDGMSLYCPGADPGLPFVLRPSVTGTWRGLEYNVEVRTNALGFRDEEFALPPDPGQFVIACLGDSMAMGQGVDEDDIFCTLAEKALRSALPPVRIHNMAVSGYAQSMQVRQIELAGTLGARLLLLAACPSNDVLENDGIVIRGIDADHFRSDGGLKRPIQGYDNPVPTWIERHLRLYPVVKSRLGLTQPMTAVGSAPWYTLDQLRKTPDERTLHAFARTTELLNEMLDKCAQKGMSMAVISCPQQYELSPDLFGQVVRRYEVAENEVDRAAVTRFYQAWCQSHKVAFLDMAVPLTDAGKSPQDLFFRLDGHPNAQGHAIMAEALAGFLDIIITNIEQSAAA